MTLHCNPFGVWNFAESEAVGLLYRLLLLAASGAFGTNRVGCFAVGCIPEFYLWIVCRTVQLSASTVELIKSYDRERAAGMVNAVLRKIASNKDHLPEISKQDMVNYLYVRYSHPAWLVKHCIELLGEAETEKFLKCNNEAVETTVQYNPLKGSEEKCFGCWKMPECK